MLDCLIIGGGVVGCAIARVLSRYRLNVTLVEAGEDVAVGASRANSAIVHAGYDCEPGSDMARYNVRGNALMETWCAQLHVPLSRTGSLVLAFDGKGMDTLQTLRRQGELNGVPGLEIWDYARTLGAEPALNPFLRGALYAPTGGITCPYELTIACAENAAGNGVNILCDWPVEALERIDGGLRASGPKGALEARVVVNAAGVFADDIARMVGDESFTIRARRGEYMLLDRNAGGVVSRVIFQVPGPMGKGVLVSPTIDGNLFAGPTAEDIEDKRDTSTTEKGLAFLRAASVRSVPTIPLSQTIRSFTGLRAVADTGDFIIRPSRQASRLVHAAGICSPGLTSAPAIAEAVCEMVGRLVPLDAKSEYQPQRTALHALRHMSAAQRETAIEADPRYAQIVCRCEMVSEAEIVNCIRRVPGARSLDGVKRRTRAGMGRCQGGFCSPKVMRILSRELSIPMEAITLSGGESFMLTGNLEVRDADV